MYIPLAILIFMLGYIFCLITAYVYIRIQEYIENKKIKERKRKRMEEDDVQKRLLWFSQRKI